MTVCGCAAQDGVREPDGLRDDGLGVRREPIVAHSGWATAHLVGGREGGAGATLALAACSRERCATALGDAAFPARPGRSASWGSTGRTCPGSARHPVAGGPAAAAQTDGVVTAVSFTWLGMVLAISFLEAPLKFRAPGVTVPLGLGIGRVVFRSLNRVELALLVLVLIGVAVAPRPALVGIAAALVVLVGVQLGAVRPALNRRSDRVLAGEELPRSRGHLLYLALEVIKAALLVALGSAALA